MNMLKEIKDAWDKMVQAQHDYNVLRNSCKHTGIKTWKSKYGGLFCEDCETFLPRDRTAKEVLDDPNPPENTNL